MFNNSYKKELDPDEIFLDSSNLPSFETERFEGRIEYALSKRSLLFLGLFFIIVAVLFTSRLFFLQVVNGEDYAVRSADNSLDQTVLFSERGVVYDRNGVLLAWNDEEGNRVYVDSPGFAHVVGYTGFPSQLDQGVRPDQRIGKAGIEERFDDLLRGSNGLEIIEKNALGEVISESIQEKPERGETLSLSIDAKIQAELYKNLSDLVDEREFEAGSAVVLDVKTGEIIALTNYPEFDPNILTKGEDGDAIQGFFLNERKPFLNRAVSGLYTPGSTIKPFVAAGALEEDVIDPSKQIYSSGELVLPNPYDPDNPSIFLDWKAHGNVDMRRAIAVSSNVYFYQIGGGFEDQEGLGISRIEKYTKDFGFGSPTGFTLDHEPEGTIPSPEWKEKVFDGEPWRLGDTYHTAIGQYGFQVTPLQLARAVSSIANGGVLYTPRIVRAREKPGELEPAIPREVGVSQDNLKIVREGMRLGVTEGTASGLNGLGAVVAAKTGTAELGVNKDFVNSWVTGFFPYEEPRYAFALVMERGPRANVVGATYAMRQTIEWMKENAPEYLGL